MSNIENKFNESSLKNVVSGYEKSISPMKYFEVVAKLNLKTKEELKERGFDLDGNPTVNLFLLRRGMEGTKLRAQGLYVLGDQLGKGNNKWAFMLSDKTSVLKIQDLDSFINEIDKGNGELNFCEEAKRELGEDAGKILAYVSRAEKGVPGVVQERVLPTSKAIEAAKKIDPKLAVMLEAAHKANPLAARHVFEQKPRNSGLIVRGEEIYVVAFDYSEADLDEVDGGWETIKEDMSKIIPLKVEDLNKVSEIKEWLIDIGHKELAEKGEEKVFNEVKLKEPTKEEREIPNSDRSRYFEMVDGEEYYFSESKGKIIETHKLDEKVMSDEIGEYLKNPDKYSIFESLGAIGGREWKFVEDKNGNFITAVTMDKIRVKESEEILQRLGKSIIAKDIEKKSVLQLLEELNKLPSMLVEQVEKAGGKVKISDEDISILTGRNLRNRHESNRVMAAYFLDSKTAYATGREKISYSVLHEYGHLYKDLLCKDENINRFFLNAHARLYPKLDEYYKGSGPGKTDGAEELFAQSFADYYAFKLSKEKFIKKYDSELYEHINKMLLKYEENE